jgi:hypothetical protein
MALYEVYHNRALYPTSGFSVSELKPNKLAQAITRIHCERFTMPAMFVTVKLIHFSPEAEFSREYVGGIWVSQPISYSCFGLVLDGVYATLMFLFHPFSTEGFRFWV